MHHRLLASRWPLLWGVILAWSWTAAPRAWSADPVRVEYNTDKAVALVKRTGRPLLAIGGTTNCPYCVRMARQLETNEALAPLAAKYVILKIDTSTPLWQEWTRRYEVEGDGVPQVIILRGDGQQIYGKAGAPVELDRFLEKYLADAGTVLTDRELADLEKLVKEAQKNLKKRDYPKAIELAQECLREECHAEAVGEARKVLDQVAERAKIGLKDAQKKLATRDKALDGAVALLELKETFAGHSEAAGPIADAVTSGQQDSTRATLFEQAEVVREARAKEQARQFPAAIESWQSLVEKFPDSPGAELARRRIADLAKKVPGGSRSKSPERAQPE